MSENAQARGGDDGRSAPASEFPSALSTGTGGTLSGGAAASPAPTAPALPSETAEGVGVAEAAPGSRITGALHEPSVPQSQEEALDRPSKPVLAGAAIAGLLLVAAPFAMTVGVPGVTLETTPLASDAGGAGGQTSGTAEAGASAGGETGAAAQADTGAAPQQGAAPQETGYVPEVGGDGATTPTMPDPGTGTTGGENPVETVPAAQEGSEAASAPTSESVTGEPGAEATVSGDGTREGVPADGAEDGTAAGDGDGVTDGTAGGDGGEAGAPANENGANAPATDGEDTGSTADGEGAGTADQNPDTATTTQDGAAQDDAAREGNAGNGDTARENGGGTGDAANGGAPADPPVTNSQPGTDPPPSEGGGSVLEDAVATTGGSEPKSFLAVAGPGCQASPGASYTNAGRWDSAEGTASWATRPGGYPQEGCDGGYEALPVSGDPERGNGQYAAWTFTPGEAGVVCELYVHVPDDESPLWISPGEARYQIFSGPAAEGSAVSVFGFDQAQIRGGWVQVTGFTSPTEEFTVQLTNAGADALADQEHTSAHVAASAVRASCS